MSDEPGHTPRRMRVLDVETEHTLRNHLAIIVGFSELLLNDLPTDDPRAGDLQEIHKAANAAMRLLTPDEP